MSVDKKFEKNPGQKGMDVVGSTPANPANPYTVTHPDDDDKTPVSGEITIDGKNVTNTDPRVLPAAAAASAAAAVNPVTPTTFSVIFPPSHPQALPTRSKSGDAALQRLGLVPSFPTAASANSTSLVSAVGDAWGAGGGGGGGGQLTTSAIGAVRAIQANALARAGASDDFTHSVLTAGNPRRSNKSDEPETDPAMIALQTRRNEVKVEKVTKKDLEIANEQALALTAVGTDDALARAAAIRFDMAAMAAALPTNGGPAMKLLYDVAGKSGIPFDDRDVVCNAAHSTAIAVSRDVQWGVPLTQDDRFDDLVQCRVGTEVLSPIMYTTHSNCSAVYGSQGKVTNESGKAFAESAARYGSAVLSFNTFIVFGAPITAGSSEDEVCYKFVSIEAAKPIFQMGVTKEQTDRFWKMCMRSSRGGPGLEHSVRNSRVTYLDGTTDEIVVIEVNALATLAAFTLSEAYIGRSLHMAHRDGIENGKKSGHIHAALNLVKNFYHQFPMMIRMVQKECLAEWKRLLLSSTAASVGGQTTTAAAAAAAAPAAATTAATAAANHGSNGSNDMRAENERLRREVIQLRHTLGQATEADAKMRAQLEPLKHKYNIAIDVIHHLVHYVGMMDTVFKTATATPEQKYNTVYAHVVGARDGLSKKNLPAIFDNVVAFCSNHSGVACSVGRMYNTWKAEQQNARNTANLRARGAFANQASSQSGRPAVAAAAATAASPPPNPIGFAPAPPRQ